MRYVIKDGCAYLSSLTDRWTGYQREAYKFVSHELALDCAEAWREGVGRKPNARVVRLVRKAVAS